MLAKKLIVLACLLCAGSALATELDEAVKGAMSDDYQGIVADKAIETNEPLHETMASGGDDSRPGGEEPAGDANS